MRCVLSRSRAYSFQKVYLGLLSASRGDPVRGVGGGVNYLRERAGSADDPAMIGERTTEGWEVGLRPRGAGRFFSAAFLLFWLCGWAAGEAFAIWILVKGASALLTGEPLNPGGGPLEVGPALAAGAFLLFWLSIWTIGGIGAIAALFQMLWAEDRVVAGSAGVTLRWIRGPFRGRREFPRDQLRGIETVLPRGNLSLRLDRRRVELSALGTPAEREDAAAVLRRELGLPAEESARVQLPESYEEIITPEGERAVVASRATRAVQARVALLAAAGMAAVAFFVIRDALTRAPLVPMAVIVTVAAAALIWGAVWLSRARTELRIGSGSITVRRRFGTGLRDRFEARRLEVVVTTDSDGDDRIELVGFSAPSGAELPGPAPIPGARTPRTRHTLASALHDPTVPRMLGAWLAQAADVPLADRATPQAREAELNALMEQFEQTGKFGRVAISLIRKVRERQGSRLRRGTGPGSASA